MIASASERPKSLISIAILSSRTIALLMMMPDNEINPRIVKKPKVEFATSKPNVTPISPSGIVVRIITGRRSELNCPISSKTINMPAMGSSAAIDAFASPDSSVSPPIANVWPSGQFACCSLNQGLSFFATSAAVAPAANCTFSDIVRSRSRRSTTPGSNISSTSATCFNGTCLRALCE